ncbi:MAG: hypothetical protein EBX15_04445, partial [Acidimicrobiia bacterium]|nr:hypothetical protein [Acidimicrobiia bacterium]
DAIIAAPPKPSGKHKANAHHRFGENATAILLTPSTPIGGPITGLIADYVSLEWSMAYGGVLCFACVAVLAWKWR